MDEDPAADEVQRPQWVEHPPDRAEQGGGEHQGADPEQHVDDAGRGVEGVVQPQEERDQEVAREDEADASQGPPEPRGVEGLGEATASGRPAASPVSRGFFQSAPRATKDATSATTAAPSAAAKGTGRSLRVPTPCMTRSATADRSPAPAVRSPTNRAAERVWLTAP